jgi:uncharacterized repeat protein (TIGR01451 family)
MKLSTFRLTCASAVLPALLISTASAGTPASGLLYYTRYQSPAEVKKVNYSYDGATNFVFSNAVSIVTLNGADGLTVAPDGSLIVGTCGGGAISKVNPLTGAYTSVPAGGGACHLALDPNRARAWAGFTYSGSTALSEIPLIPYFTNGIAHPVVGSENAVGTLAWDPAGNAFYTVSGPSGVGSFGAINLTTFVTTRFLSNLAAAHGMAYDPFSGTFILFGNTHVTQVVATPTNATIIGDLAFAVSEFDQGTVDGRGHIFAADNGGYMIFIDYSGSGYLTNATTFTTLRYLDSFLDDVAPVGLVGSGNIADVALSLVATPNPALVRSNLTLTSTVTNAGPTNATGIVLTDNLPANATLVSASSSLGSCTVSNGAVTCTASNLAANKSFTVTVTLQPLSGPLTLHALALANESDPYFPNNIVDTTVPAPYACLPPTSGLVSWWPAENTSRDANGTNHGSLSVTNSFSYAPGEVGSTFAFDGVSQYFTANGSPSLRPANLTLECWAMFNRYDGCRVLMGKPFGGGTDNSYVLWAQDGILHATSYFTSGGGPVLSYNFFPAPGVWYHLAYAVDASGSGSQVLYVNGQPVAAATAGGVLNYDSHPLLIGGDINGGSYNCLFSGMIDESAIYSRALAPAEVQAIYQAGAQGKCMAPVLVPAALVAATTNVPYSQPISLAHASPAFTFAQTGGTLPPGMTLLSDGSFFGTPPRSAASPSPFVARMALARSPRVT